MIAQRQPVRHEQPNTGNDAWHPKRRETVFAYDIVKFIQPEDTGQGSQTPESYIRADDGIKGQHAEEQREHDNTEYDSGLKCSNSSPQRRKVREDSVF